MTWVARVAVASAIALLGFGPAVTAQVPIIDGVVGADDADDGGEDWYVRADDDIHQLADDEGIHVRIIYTGLGDRGLNERMVDSYLLDGGWDAVFYLKAKKGGLVYDARFSTRFSPDDRADLLADFNAACNGMYARLQQRPWTIVLRAATELLPELAIRALPERTGHATAVKLVRGARAYALPAAARSSLATDFSALENVAAAWRNHREAYLTNGSAGVSGYDFGVDRGRVNHSAGRISSRLASAQWTTISVAPDYTVSTTSAQRPLSPDGQGGYADNPARVWLYRELQRRRLLTPLADFAVFGGASAEPARDLITDLLPECAGFGTFDYGLKWRGKGFASFGIPILEVAGVEAGASYFDFAVRDKATGIGYSGGLGCREFSFSIGLSASASPPVGGGVLVNPDRTLDANGGSFEASFRPASDFHEQQFTGIGLTLDGGATSGVASYSYAPLSILHFDEDHTRNMLTNAALTQLREGFGQSTTSHAYDMSGEGIAVGVVSEASATLANGTALQADCQYFVYETVTEASFDRSAERIEALRGTDLLPKVASFVLEYRDGDLATLQNDLNGTAIDGLIGAAANAAQAAGLTAAFTLRSLYTGAWSRSGPVASAAANAANLTGTDALTAKRYAAMDEVNAYLSGLLAAQSSKAHVTVDEALPQHLPSASEFEFVRGGYVEEPIGGSRAFTVLEIRFEE